MSSAAAAFSALGQAGRQMIARCAIVGFGSLGEEMLFKIERFSRQNSANAQLRLTAVCDIFPYRLSYFRRLCEHNEQIKKSDILALGCQTYEDFDLMLKNERIDVLFVCTPDCFHEKHAVAALQRGIHVWCALPLADSVKSAQNIVRCAKHSGAVLGCAPHFGATFLHAQELIEKYCLLGKIVHLRSTNAVGVKTCGLRHSKEEIYSFNNRKRETDHYPTAILAKYGFNSCHEAVCWRQYRKFGLDEMLGGCYYTSGSFYRLLPSLPVQVKLSGYNGPEKFSNPAMVKFDYLIGGRKVSAEILSFGVKHPHHVTCDIYGEFGRIYIGGISFFELKHYGIGQGRFDWENRGIYGITSLREMDKVLADKALGERLDMSAENIMDNRSILTFESDDLPPQKKQEELLKLDTYLGESDKWLFPERLKNVWSGVLHLDNFLKRVAENRIDMAEIHEAYIAQIMADGVERAQKNGCHKFDRRQETFTQRC